MNCQKQCSVVQRVLLLLKKIPPVLKLTQTVYLGSPGSSSLTNRPGISHTEPSGVSGFGNVNALPGYTMSDAGRSTVNTVEPG